MNKEELTMNNKIEQIYSDEFTRAIGNIVKEGSKVKTMIFKAHMMNSDIDQYTVKYYISFINGFLEVWQKYAETLLDRMKSTSGREGIKTVPYESVKNYVYATYDYASVLRFAADVINKIKNGDITETSDIDDEFITYVSKSFDTNITTSAGLVDDVVIDYDGTVVSDKLGAKMFDSIKNYPKLFKSSDRIELYNACKKTVEFLSSEVSVPNRSNVYEMKLFIAMINSIIDYVTYSLTAYVARIYMISSYAYPFIKRETRIVSESVDPHEMLDTDSIGIDIMRFSDDAVFKDIDNFHKLAELTNEFVIATGGTGLSNDEFRSYAHRNECNSNMFSDAIDGNELLKYIKDFYHSDLIEMRNKNGISEARQVLHTLLYDNRKTGSVPSSSKSEILYAIANVGGHSSINGIQNTAHDLAMFTLSILFWLYKSYDSMDSFYRKDNTISSNTDYVECTRMMNELYRDIAITSLNRMRDLETTINRMKGSNADEVVNKLKLSVPGDTTSNIAMSVPDTVSAPLGMYVKPIKECMDMYDDYLRMLPMFENDLYLSEAFNLSSLWNMLLSTCSGWWKKAEAFYTNKKLLGAVKWVTDHKSEILNMDYSSISLQILPYKKQISFPKGYENFENNLKQYNPSNMTSDDAVNNFIKSLYPDEVVYGWFKNGGENGGLRMLKNYMLYQDDPRKVTDKNPELITCKGSDVLTHVKEWVEVVESNTATFDQLRKIKDRVNGVMADARDASVKATQQSTQQNNSQQQISSNTQQSTNTPQVESVMMEAEGNSQQAQNTSSQSQPQNSQSQSTTPSQQQSSNQSSSSGNNNKNDANKSDDPSVNNKGNNKNTQQFIDRARDGMVLAFNRIFGFTLKVFQEYELTSYKYLKDAYSQGRKK